LWFDKEESLGPENKSSVKNMAVERKYEVFEVMSDKCKKVLNLYLNNNFFAGINLKKNNNTNIYVGP
jgi:hypothetical protein